MRPGQPAAIVAAVHALLNVMIRRGCFSPRRRSATNRKNTHGSMWPAFLERDVRGVLSLKHPAQIVGKWEYAPVTILRCRRPGGSRRP